MTDSDSSPFEVDSRGFRVNNAKKLSKRSGSSSKARCKREGSSSSISLSEIDPESVFFLSCSQVVRDVTQQFDVQKKKWVESIGFGGLLHLPNIPSRNKSFSVWLLSCLKWFTLSLQVGQNINMLFSAEHIGKIIGLNHTGIDVSEKAFESLSEKTCFLQARLGFLHTSSDIVQAAQSFIEAPAPKTTSELYISNFKTAFVIFAMGRFLAPGENYSEGNCDFWGALEQPTAINCYNWSKYVLSNIQESARILEWDIVANRKLSAISCCTFLVEIFYLDNVDFGKLSLPHNVLPRVKHFSNDIISRMIECDRSKDTTSKGSPCFGSVQICRFPNPCYQLCIETVTNPPPGFTPIAHVHALSSLTSPKEPRKPKVDRIRSSNHPSLSSSLPVAASVLPVLPAPPSCPNKEPYCVESLINDRVQGPARGHIIEAIRVHQERCSVHMQSFTDGLKNAIAKENTDLLRCIIDQVISTPDLQQMSPLGARRIIYGGTPVSESRHQKTRRVNSSSPIELAALVSGSQAGRVVPQRLASSDRSFSLAETPSSKNQNTSSHITTTPHQLISKHRHHKDKQRTSGQHSAPRGASADQIMFQSPQPSVNLFGTEQRFSPTTENKIFNGISLSARQITSMKTFDLNVKSFAAEYSSSPIIKRKVQLGPLARSHWSLALESPPLRSPSICANFFQWLVDTSKGQDINRPWIMHEYPRFIQLEGSQLRSEFVYSNPMSYSVFDIIIRRMKQIDRAIYAATAPLRWRHLFESDFSMHVLGDDQPVENLAVRDQFTGPDIDYELCRCGIFFVPVLSNGVWWCYALDMKNKTIFIIDPSNANESDDNLISLHIGTMQSIKDNLDSTISILFSGWNPIFTQCTPKVFRMKFTPCLRSHSGFFTLFTIANFDGSTMASDPSPPNIHKFKQQTIYEILCLEENRASPPNAFVHVID